MNRLKTLLSNLINKSDQSVFSISERPIEFATNPSFQDILIQNNLAAVPTFDRDFVSPWSPEEEIEIRKYLDNPVIIVIDEKYYAVDLIALKRKPAYFNLFGLSGKKLTMQKKLVITYNQHGTSKEPLFYSFAGNNLAKALYEANGDKEVIKRGTPIELNPSNVFLYSELSDELKESYPLNNQLSNRKGALVNREG